MAKDFEVRDNSGVLFENDRKTEDRFPDRKGSALIGGVEYWVSGWIKTDRNGNRFMSMAFKPKVPATAAVIKPAPQRGPIRGGSAIDDLNDQVPFGPEWR